jgi:hypothetical protein
MARSTPEAFCDWLDEQHSWRISEIRNYFLVASKYNSTSSRSNPVTRAGIPLLYAHWEGFVKEVALEYLKFLSRMRLTNSTLNDSLLAISLRKTAGLRANALDFDDLLRIISFFRDMPNESCQLKGEDSINTRSNLRWSVFREILLVMGMDPMVYHGKEVVIDARIVDVRNSIAHGEYVFIDFDSYQTVHNLVIELLSLFRSQVENALLLRNYRATSSPWTR